MDKAEEQLNDKICNAINESGLEKGAICGILENIKMSLYLMRFDSRLKKLEAADK